MKWNHKDRYRWRRAFAWLPVKIGDQTVWLEPYWWQDMHEYRAVSLDPPVERKPIMLEIAEADDEAVMWERRWKALKTMNFHDTNFADSDGQWVLSDFIAYAGRACGFDMSDPRPTPPERTDTWK